jgi:hypothetical protein
MQTIQTTDSPCPILHTVKQFSLKHPFATEGGLRYEIFNAETNGLKNSEALVRVGRKVLINEEKYFGWIESQQADQKGGAK